jgi:hypothetical protein
MIVCVLFDHFVVEIARRTSYLHRQRVDVPYSSVPISMQQMCGVGNGSNKTGEYLGLGSPVRFAAPWEA